VPVLLRGPKHAPLVSSHAALEQLTRATVLVAVLVALAGLVADLQNTVHFGGVDLRNRVVGARALALGLDPYYLKWSPRLPQTLLDPADSPTVPNSRVTVPPTVLALHRLVAWTPYREQRIAWFVAQWALLLLATWLLAASAPSGARRQAVWVVGLLVIGGAWLWRLHVERGQIVVLPVALLAASYRYAVRGGPRGLLTSGMLIGLAAAMRPTIAIMVLPMMTMGAWPALIGFATGAVGGVACALPLAGMAAWRSYFASVHGSDAIHLKLVPWTPPYFGGVVDGMGGWARALSVPTADVSLQYVVWSLAHFRLSPNALGFCLLVLAVAVCAMVRHRHHEHAPTGVVLVVGYTLAVVADLFVPAARYSYCDVMLLPPLGAMLSGLPAEKLLQPVPLALLLLGSLFGIGLEWVPRSVAVGEACMMAYILWGALALAAQPSFVSQEG